MPRPCDVAGILLRRFLGDPSLQGISHVVIDEVHERSVDVDLSLLLLRDLIAHGSSIKVILMSATANAELFAAYFSNTGHKVQISTLLLDSAPSDDTIYPPHLSAISAHYRAVWLLTCVCLCIVLLRGVELCVSRLPGNQSPVYACWGRVHSACLSRQDNMKANGKSYLVCQQLAGSRQPSVSDLAKAA